MRTASGSTIPDLPVVLACLGRATKELRRERGLEVEELAVCAGLSIRHVLLLEGGRVNEAFDNLCRLADALDVGLHALFCRVDELGAAR
jgi:transcriptional regulator with XRE-family HTH domain